MFSRRWIINYVLIVLIVIFTYVGNKFDVQTGYQPRQHITGLKPENIESVEIVTADTTLALKRDNGGWMLEAPIQWPANNVNVERLLSIASAETDSRLPANEIDLATLGLKFPKAILRLNDTEVLFGATNNIGARRYTMVGSTVFLLPDQHLPFITQGLTAMVDRRLLPQTGEFKALKLPEFEISRSDDNTWLLTGADGSGQDQVAGLVENWQNLQATRLMLFAADKVPQQKIRVQFANNQIQEFFVMSIDPEIIIANPQIGLQYHFPAELYYQLISLRANEISG